MQQQSLGTEIALKTVATAVGLTVWISECLQSS